VSTKAVSAGASEADGNIVFKAHQPRKLVPGSVRLSDKREFSFLLVWQVNVFIKNGCIVRL